MQSWNLGFCMVSRHLRSLTHKCRVLSHSISKVYVRFFAWNPPLWTDRTPIMKCSEEPIWQLALGIIQIMLPYVKSVIPWKTNELPWLVISYVKNIATPCGMWVFARTLQPLLKSCSVVWVGPEKSGLIPPCPNCEFSQTNEQLTYILNAARNNEFWWLDSSCYRRNRSPGLTWTSPLNRYYFDFLWAYGLLTAQDVLRDWIAFRGAYGSDIFRWTVVVASVRERTFGTRKKEKQYTVHDSLNLHESTVKSSYRFSRLPGENECTNWVSFMTSVIYGNQGFYNLVSLQFSNFNRTSHYLRTPLIPHLQELDLIVFRSDYQGCVGLQRRLYAFADHFGWFWAEVLTHADVRHLGALPYVFVGCISHYSWGTGTFSTKTPQNVGSFKFQTLSQLSSFTSSYSLWHWVVLLVTFKTEHRGKLGCSFKGKAERRGTNLADLTRLWILSYSPVPFFLVLSLVCYLHRFPSCVTLLLHKFEHPSPALVHDSTLLGIASKDCRVVSSCKRTCTLCLYKSCHEHLYNSLMKSCFPIQMP